MFILLMSWLITSACRCSWLVGFKRIVMSEPLSLRCHDIISTNDPNMTKTETELRMAPWNLHSRRTWRTWKNIWNKSLKNQLLYYICLQKMVSVTFSLNGILIFLSTLKVKNKIRDTTINTTRATLKGTSKQANKQINKHKQTNKQTCM